MEDRLAANDTRTADSFERWAGWAALASAVAVVVYTVTFVATVAAKVPGLQPIYSLALVIGSLLSAVALFAVYERIRDAGSLARLGLILALAGVMGAAIHGAYDLAVVIGPEGGFGGPHPVDPRGFLTFGVAGLGVLILSWAGLRVASLPRNLLYLGLLFGVLLVVIYLSRLIVFNATSPLVLGPAAIGAVVSVVWYAWVGRLLLGRRA